MTKAVLNPLPIEEDFEKVFKEQFPLIYNYIFYHLGNVADAEDLTADVFVRAYEYWGSYSSEKGSRGAWMGGIARNMVKTYFGKKGTRPQITELPEFICADINIEENYLRKEKLLQVFKQMDALPELQRELMTMKYFMNLSNRDIAKITGMSESNVGVILHRTIKKIQKKLQSYAIY